MKFDFLRHISLPIALIIAFLSGEGTANAQVDAIFTQYWAVPNYYNPAAIGTTDFVQIRGGARLQWVGIENAPKTFLITADSPFKLFNKRVGAGIVLNQESIGLYNTLSAAAQLSYKLKFFKGTLSLGVQLGFLDEKFRGSEVKLPDGSGDDSTSTEDGNSTGGTTEEIGRAHV